MQKFEFGNANNILIQPVGEEDFSLLEEEISLISSLTKEKFALWVYRVESWNDELSPWAAPAVFGKVPFGGRAEETLNEILKDLTDKSKTYLIGGYSLAGLFALWAAHKTNVFSAVSAASPSLWYPNFINFMRETPLQCERVYLSLGTLEERAKNPVLKTVSENLNEAYRLLQAAKKDCAIEWNEGNHFQDAEKRTAKAFAWALNGSEKG